MQEQVISFETAKLAKELGFDIPCRKYYGQPSDDVYIETLAKSKDQTRTKSIEMYNDPFTFYEHLEQGKIAIILVEINEVKL